MALQFRPNLPKIAELLLYLAHKKPGADKYQAVKFFYLADREHLNRFGRPITSDEYYALQYGPVASNAKDLLEQDKWALMDAGMKELPFQVDMEARRGPDKVELLIIGEPKRAVDMEIFSRSDLRVFDEILEKYGDYDFDALYNLTHNHMAYKRAWLNRGSAMRAYMPYDDMISSPTKRESILSDIGPVAAHL
ncbi:MAG: Panacea domain-containing protein [Hyphomicrobiales bacterium]